MTRFLLALFLAASLPLTARAATAAGQQELVDRATLAAQDVLTTLDGATAQRMLRHSRAVLICPRVFKAGFLFGAEGGGCVLLARGGGGSWSAPAFYSMGAGSFGLQAGIQDAEVMMVIQTERGLRSVMDSQFKFGAGASVALVTIGGGIEGATPASFSADIVAFARTRGLFVGVSLQGSMLSSDSEGDEVYYGQPVGPSDIVVQMRVNNPGADPLRTVLMRYGGSGPAAAMPAAGSYPPTEQPVAAFPPAQPGPVSLAPVQEQSLATPGH
ncbi:MAG TPA: lipid-binding SYLF domain-containing protein [Acetobacteraceae bacterium]|nr:lipid-binding SYLF domain-containing protein [Acetobacteraceae bacterium]